MGGPHVCVRARQYQVSMGRSVKDTRVHRV